MFILVSESGDHYLVIAQDSFLVEDVYFPNFRTEHVVFIGRNGYLVRQYSNYTLEMIEL